MNKVMEILLIAFALAGLFSAISTINSRSGDSAVRAEQTVIVADGSDPMPLCRGKHCQ
jgi:hypothetical protein